MSRTMRSALPTATSDPVNRGFISRQRRQLVKHFSTSNDTVDQGRVSIKLILDEIVDCFQKEKDEMMVLLLREEKR